MSLCIHHNTGLFLFFWLQFPHPSTPPKQCYILRDPLNPFQSKNPHPTLNSSICSS
ncbi:putative signal peptide protein [Puccinia sorghi]|uniref:Putative signal peptide protein n=1 Tax=Puccinia sorghi TaxID=27349 RepID=A0A0L6VC57_9BASI|nr:putative signal peptide protein [Puccinia sorghi]